MKGYTAEDLKKHFERCGRIRIGRSEFANDAGYWTGGTCNWGANHNLREDCQTIANSFAKIESLKDIQEVLRNCHSNQEYETKKANFIQKCNESINGLRPRVGPSSSMFGICIIWADQAMSPEVERQIEGCKREVQKIKSSLEKESYQWVEELNRIQLEINEIKKRMEENKKRAMNPNLSPQEKLAILEEVEKDGELLKQKSEEYKRYSDKFRFDPSKYISGITEAIKRAIEKGEKSSGSSGSGSGGSGRSRGGSNHDDPFGSSGGSSLPNEPIDPRTLLRRKSDQSGENKDNSQMILMAIVVALVLFFLMNQKEKPIREGEFDYY